MVEFNVCITNAMLDFPRKYPMSAKIDLRIQGQVII